jgi:hypothetical protein
MEKFQEGKACFETGGGKRNTLPVRASPENWVFFS